ncbi:putative dehydrogenase [Flavobacterium arsenatis]|uniref:Dehydrogenase n=1 Tax=Flavobacterium arsenatis TaxID=1484332 RepID=A0ABU1TT26_9FLAO|nr:Gfo/Idh/MocA family oxidoreductase [Flavobacterium arsenatis]MDR6969011.1 putative dehydrogenase [Flavobacterium arsenatis]
MQKIKTALLSFGMSGKVFHAPFLELHEGFELVGSWERSKQLIRKEYPKTKSYPSLESILEDDEIDLVIVNTPTDTHFDYAKKALLAGKHVLVEKAFTTTVAEAEELASLAKEKKLKLSVFQNRRWDSDFKTVKDVLDKDLLGEITEAEFHFDRYSPSLSIKTHKETPSSGSGILMDLGPHLIDQALFLFGFPEAVFADSRITRDRSVVDDYTDILLYYPRFRVRLKASLFVREAIPSFVIHGKNGSFLKKRGDIQEDALKIGKKPNLKNWGTESRSQEGLLHTESGGKIIHENIPTLQGNYYGFFDELYTSITQNTEEPVTAQDGINTMRIIEGAIKSNKQKQVIQL